MSEGPTVSDVFGSGAGTAEKRDSIRAEVSKLAEACAGKEASEGLIEETARLFSRNFLAEVALGRGIKVTKCTNKGAIVQVLFQDRWVPPSDEEAISIFKAFKEKHDSSDSSGDEMSQETAKDEKVQTREPLEGQESQSELKTSNSSRGQVDATLDLVNPASSKGNPEMESRAPRRVTNNRGKVQSTGEIGGSVHGFFGPEGDEGQVAGAFGTSHDSSVNADVQEMSGGERGPPRSFGVSLRTANDEVKAGKKVISSRAEGGPGTDGAKNRVPKTKVKGHKRASEKSGE